MSHLPIRRLAILYMEMKLSSRIIPEITVKFLSLDTGFHPGEVLMSASKGFVLLLKGKKLGFLT